MSEPLPDELIGEMVAGDDGFYVFWPTGNLGAYSAALLRSIADKLDEKNKPVWKYYDENYFRNLKCE